MARTKYPWETYVRSMIIRFPEFEREIEELRRPSLVPPMDKVGHSSGVSHPTEAAALRELPPTKQRQYDAVRLAIERTERLPDGVLRMKLIDLMYWTPVRYNLHGAALRIPCSARTASTWHTNFIRSVGMYAELMEEDFY